MNWFKNQMVGTKLQISFAAINLFVIIVGVFGIISINRVQSRDQYMYDNSVLSLRLLGTIKARTFEVASVLNNMTYLQDGKAEERIAARNEIRQNLTGLYQQYEATISTGEEKALYETVKEKRAAYLAAGNKLDDLVRQNNFEGARAVMQGEMGTALKELQGAVENSFEYNVKFAEQTKNENISTADTAKTMTVIILIISTLLAAAVALSISKMIKEPVGKVLAMAQELVKGHVKARANVEGKDEIAEMAKATDTIAHQLDQLAQGMQKIAIEGDTSVRVPVYDSQDALGPALNAIGDTLTGLVSEATMLTKAAVEGRLSTRGNSEKFRGGFRDIVAGVNSTLDAVIKPVMDGTNVLRVMATGDLTLRMTGNYQGDHEIIKTSINSLADSMSGAIYEVSQAVQATASAANEISSSTEEMASGAQEQSSQTVEIAGSVEEMTKTILETSQNAVTASERAKNAGDVAKEGGHIVDKTIEGMQQISKVVSEAAATVGELGKSSEQIGEIIEVIDDIADQTNLLALNAAIEAARAGEQGRGFAVVADEVRKLAERTSKATKEIADMIKKIQSDTDGAVRSINAGTSEVEKGKELADSAGSSLRQIIESAGSVVDLVNQVAAASEEQSAAAEQISKNIESITTVTQQSAAGIQEIARASEDLSRLTDNLNSLLNRFRIDVSAHDRIPDTASHLRHSRKMLGH